MMPTSSEPGQRQRSFKAVSLFLQQPPHINNSHYPLQRNTLQKSKERPISSLVPELNLFGKPDLQKNYSSNDTRAIQTRPESSPLVNAQNYKTYPLPRSAQQIYKSPGEGYHGKEHLQSLRGSHNKSKLEKGQIRKQLQLENMELRQKKINGMINRLELKLNIFNQKKEDFQREIALHQRHSVIHDSHSEIISPDCSHTGESGRSSGKSEASPAAPRTARRNEESELEGQIAMIRAPSLVDLLKNQEPPSARTELSQEISQSSFSGKSQTLLARVVSSGNSSSVGSQSLNSARLLSGVLSPREEEDSSYQGKLAPPIRSLPNLETLAEEREGGAGDDESSADYNNQEEMGEKRKRKESSESKQPVLRTMHYPSEQKSHSSEVQSKLLKIIESKDEEIGRYKEVIEMLMDKLKRVETKNSDLSKELDTVKRQILSLKKKIKRS